MNKDNPSTEEMKQAINALEFNDTDHAQLTVWTLQFLNQSKYCNGCKFLDLLKLSFEVSKTDKPFLN